jgi:cytidine deaminase
MLKKPRVPGWAVRVLPNAKARKTRVAARLVTKSGNVYYGVNVESSCHTLSVCAERVAIFKAVSDEGSNMAIKTLEVIAVKNDREVIDIIPCGGCRQLTSEFSYGMTMLCGRFILEWIPDPYK